MSKHISTDLQLTTWNRAAEEDPNPEVTNIISTIDSHLHYQDTTNMPIGQICTFIPIKIEITIILFIMIVTDIIMIVDVSHSVCYNVVKVFSLNRIISLAERQAFAPLCELLQVWRKCVPCNLGRPKLYGKLFIFIILIYNIKISRDKLLLTAVSFFRSGENFSLQSRKAKTVWENVYVYNFDI